MEAQARHSALSTFVIMRLGYKYYNKTFHTNNNSLLEPTLGELDETKAPRWMEAKSFTLCACTKMWIDLIQVVGIV
uniref:Uncharacterized protein n=1 Tax=Glossina palpalis gambiensis TaxID=67801 RepID=A0A1B0B2I7_9MUSC